MLFSRVVDLVSPRCVVQLSTHPLVDLHQRRPSRNKNPVDLLLHLHLHSPNSIIYNSSSFSDITVTSLPSIRILFNHNDKSVHIAAQQPPQNFPFSLSLSLSFLPTYHTYSYYTYIPIICKTGRSQLQPELRTP